MTVQDAMLILQCYQHIAYKSQAALHVVAQARKIIDEAGKVAMEAQVGTLCTVCWGDGFHRPRENILQGPCQACDGTGRRKSGLQ